MLECHRGYEEEIIERPTLTRARRLDDWITVAVMPFMNLSSWRLFQRNKVDHRDSKFILFPTVFLFQPFINEAYHKSI